MTTNHERRKQLASMLGMITGAANETDCMEFVCGLCNLFRHGPDGTDRPEPSAPELTAYVLDAAELPAIRQALNTAPLESTLYEERDAAAQLIERLQAALGESERADQEVRRALGAGAFSRETTKEVAVRAGDERVDVYRILAPASNETLVAAASRVVAHAKVANDKLEAWGRYLPDLAEMWRWIEYARCRITELETPRLFWWFDRPLRRMHSHGMATIRCAVGPVDVAICQGDSAQTIGENILCAVEAEHAKLDAYLAGRR